MKTITKQEVVAFATNVYQDTYVAVNKIKVENTTILEVGNLRITLIALNMGTESDLLKIFNKTESAEFQALFVTYKVAIKKITTFNYMPFRIF